MSDSGLSAPAEAGAPPPKKKRRLGKRLGFGCLIVLAAGVLLVLLALLLICRSRSETTYEEVDMFATYQLTAKLRGEIFAPQRLRSNRLQTVELTPEEFRTFLKVGQAAAAIAIAAARSDRPGLDDFTVEYLDDGYIHAEAAVFSGHSWLLGGATVVSIDLKPHLADGELTLELRRLYGGSLRLPSGALQKRLNAELAALKDQELLPFHLAVKRIEVLPDGTVRLEYNPAPLLELIQSSPELAERLGVE